MQRLIFTNSKSDNFVLEYSKPFILQDLVGLSDIPVDLLSTRGYQQDGQTAEGSIFQARPVGFSVLVVGETAQQVFEYRRQLLKYFNPKDDFTVIYQNDYATVKFSCRVDSAPRFVSTQTTNGSPHQKCTVSLLCDNPYLTDVDETTLRMSIEEPVLMFPLFFCNDIKLSILSGQKVSVTNKGDVDTPVRIQFLGATTNPKITNETTGEYVKVNKDIAIDEILEISTTYGHKRVDIIRADGTRQNAFQYIDLTSKFFQLVIGENMLSYEADSGVDSAQVFIYYSNRYVGV